MRFSEIYTDGSAENGSGGWAFLILRGEYVYQEYHHWEVGTTSNRMELTAAIEALTFLYKEGGAQNVRVWTDSRYVIDGMNEGWYQIWERRNFLAGPPGDRYRAKNLDLWEKINQAAKLHKRVAWAWVKGHSGNRANERVDQLARDARIKGEIFRSENWE